MPNAEVAGAQSRINLSAIKYKAHMNRATINPGIPEDFGRARVQSPELAFLLSARVRLNRT